MLCPILAAAAAAAPYGNGLPHWAAQQPNASAVGAGYPPLQSAKHSLIYAGSETTMGSYNHGPVITFHPATGLFYANWYNGYHGESKENRCLYASSPDGAKWTAPRVSFNTTGSIGLESEPYVEVGGRLYAAASSWDVNRRLGKGAEHAGPDVLLLRQQLGADALGPVFWLADSVPKGYEALGYPTWRDMDSVTRADSAEFLGLSVRTTPRSDAGQPNERSFYALPRRTSAATADLVLLMRAGERGTPQRLFASTCTVPVSPSAAGSAPTHGQCRPGTGVFSYAQLPNGLQPAAPAGALPPLPVVDPVPAPAGAHDCNWTAPTPTDIPDSKTRTCVDALPDGRYYMLGSQIESGRNPLTLSLSSDGLAWDKVWALRYGPAADADALPAYAYPGAVWRGDTLFVTYSIDKRDIALTAVPVADL